jgi:hypothetical protein
MRRDHWLQSYDAHPRIKEFCHSVITLPICASYSITPRKTE